MQKAIIVDIDGTLALKHPDRDIYDLTKVHMDLPNEPVIDCIYGLKKITYWISSKTIHSNGNYYLGQEQHYYKFIFVSGRQNICKSQTVNWLKKHIEIIDYDLYMRKAGDSRCDTIVKREIYQEHIKGKYDVVAVFDDRPKVIRMWRELGLFVFNCAQHDNEF